MGERAIGIWDHVERRPGESLSELYEGRCQFLELADQGPFWAYHVAEHHFTPLGMAPSPSVYLSALIQRTRRIRLGSMVHLLPLYHPLRLIEELCMLDHMSNGRLEFGFGRGISPFELGHYGADFMQARAQAEEVLEILVKGMRNEVLTHHGEYFQFPGVPMELRPLQQPNPPMWYGVSSERSLKYSAERGLNVVTAGPNQALVGSTTAYREMWQQARETHSDTIPNLNPGVSEPKIGAFRMAFVAETDAAAEKKAREAYPVFYQSLQKLWIDNGTVATQFPPDYDDLAAYDTFIVGSPETVREQTEQFFAESGCNYLLVEMIWGSIGQQESMDSLGLYGEAVADLVDS